MEPSVPGIQVLASSVLEIKEVIIYPMESFVAEFGGALGLFLGFSFMMIWDAIDVMISYCMANKKIEML